MPQRTSETIEVPTTTFLIAVVLLVTSFGPLVPRGAARRSQETARPHLNQIISLPGRGGVIDTERHLVYQYALLNRADYVVAYDWSKGRLVWSTRVEADIEPVELAGEILVCARGGSAGGIWAPLVGLDRNTGQLRWKESTRAAAPHEMLNLAVTRGRIFRATPGRISCLSLTTGKTAWTRDFGSEMTALHWPHPPIVVADTVCAQISVAGIQVVGLDARDGRLRWRHSYPWQISFESGNYTHRAGPAAGASALVVSLVPTGDQRKAARGEFLLPPPSALICWRAVDGVRLWLR
jgi:outer membrane protein assembly factor BamB